MFFPMVLDSLNVPLLGSSKRRILIILKDEPLHGYEIAKRLDLPLTGIYTHLKELSELDLIESQENGRRNIYSLTAKGRKLIELLED